MKTLKEQLANKNIRISDFAKSISATSQQVCNWFERGIPKNYLIPIAKELNLTVEELLAIDTLTTNSNTTTKDSNTTRVQG